MPEYKYWTRRGEKEMARSAWRLNCEQDSAVCCRVGGESEIAMLRLSPCC